MAQQAAVPPLPTSPSFRDFDVKEKSRILQRSIDNSREHQGQDVRAVRGYFFGDRCTEPWMVTVPAVEDDYPNVVVDALRPQVWFSPEVGDDWDAIPTIITWQETAFTHMSGTRLSCGFTVFTEETTVGRTNGIIYRLTNGHPWFGNVLVMRQVDDYDDEVENISEDDLGAVENVVAR
ncbi:hypothetical protein AURDEDRAFT_123219 [Auricularia subglabra TFB-10046 SS5]|nr:hypothetical protein AURDEDRAFT_123219 [Auricularia subglabra TFB-10046 SS5]